MTSKEDLILVLEEFPTKLKSEIKKLSEEEIDKVVVTWTVRKIIHHIADSHLNSYIRVKIALTEENPTIKPYDESKWAELADYDEGIDVSLNIIQAIHKRIIIVLKQLNEKDWEKPLYHPEMGKLTLLEYVKVFADHGEGHVSKFRKL